MSTKSSAKTKGWVKNNKTGKKLSFQYNPTQFSFGKEANYVSITSPGMSVPLVQYVNGVGRVFEVSLFLYNKPHTGLIPKHVEFFDSLLPPEDNRTKFTKPPELTFCYATFIRKCVLQSMNVIYEELDRNNKPTQANITLTFIQTGV